ncbi:MAG: 1,2-phenylacetyl-CoA epoxidase subunit PaaC [Deinococcales bacterium]
MTDLKMALSDKLLALGDDELILAHRNAEWTGHAPILEEDIALANIAQDELGHAQLYYQLLESLTGQNPDQLVFFRDAKDYRNTVFCEMPKGDWAFTMLRQYLFDSYEVFYLRGLSESQYQPLADVAVKIIREEKFHVRHSGVWLERLAQSTPEAFTRLQNALNTLWPLTQQLFIPLDQEAKLIQVNYLPDLESIKQNYLANISHKLQSLNLSLPSSDTYPKNRSEHSPHLAEHLAEMQIVARHDPEAVVW